jgi:chromosome segregation ATPase
LVYRNLNGFLKLRLEHDKALHEKNGQIKALQLELTDLRVRLAKGADDIELGKEEIMKLKQELAGAEDTVSLKSSRVEDLEQQTVSLQEELQRSQNESETLNFSNARLQQEIGSMAATLREVEKARREACDGLVVANDQIVALSATNADSETQIRNLAQSMKTSSEEVEILKQKLDGLELISSQYKEEVRVKEEACGRLIKDSGDKDLVIANFQSEMETMQSSFEDLAGRFSEAQATISSLTLGLSQANNSASLAELRLAEMTDQVRKKGAERASLLSEIANLQGTLASTRDDKDRLSAQLGDLDKEKQHVGEELQQAKQDLSAVRTLLVGERQAKEELEAIVAGYVEKCDAVEEHIRRFEVSKQKDETTIANLRNILERLRESHESQLQILKEVNILW